MKFLEPKTAIASVLAASASVALWTSAGFGQAPGPFNASQVDAGHNAYVANCLICHGDTMSGGGEAPPIAGRAFIASFGAKTTRELFDILKAGMPKNAAGSLSDETYVDLVAFLLHASGAATGTASLTPTTAVRIGTIANGNNGRI